MNLNNLKAHLTFLRTLPHPTYKERDMQKLHDRYLDKTYIMCAVMLKEPHLDKMKSLQLNLPTVAFRDEAEEHLEAVFTLDHLDLEGLPQEIQNSIAAILLTHRQIAWEVFTRLTLETLIAQSDNPVEVANATVALAVMSRYQNVGPILSLEGIISVTNTSLLCPSQVPKSNL